MKDGLLLFYKEKGITSQHAVLDVMHQGGFKKCGHIGTLDPNARGLLPILVNQATKLSSLLIDHDKEYIAELEFGFETDSLDITGVKTKEDSSLQLTKEKLEEKIQSMIGKMSQTPPMVSAIKIHGKKLYEYARKNQTVEIPAREVFLYDIDILFFEPEFPYKTKLRMHVSKGFYIRSFIRDLAYSLNSYATLTELERTKIDTLSVENAYTLQNVKENTYTIIPVEEIFPNMQVLIVKDYLIPLIQNGVYLDERQIQTEAPFYVKSSNGKFLGIYAPTEKKYSYKPVYLCK